MSNLPDSQWRFEAVGAADLWACCIWEYGREWQEDSAGIDAARARLATIARLVEIPEFRARKDWLQLPTNRRAELARFWRVAPGDLEDYEHLQMAGISAPQSAAAWRGALRRLGCVVFDLGRPPSDTPGADRRRYPTRAALLARFAAWLDENPEWWNGRGDGRTVSRPGGKTDPNDGLRSLALRRVRRAYGSDKESCAFLAAEFAKNPTLKEWFAVTLAAGASAVSTRSRLKSKAGDWFSLICKPD